MHYKVTSQTSNALDVLAEMFVYRSALAALVLRAIKARYHQAVLGVLWIVLQPLLLTFVFSLVFGTFAKIPTGDVPYPLFVLCGVVMWQFVSSAVSGSSASIINSQVLVTRIYLPRFFLPLASVLVSGFDFIVVSGIFAIFLVGYGISIDVLTLIGWLSGFLICFFTALGVGSAASVLNVKYRDIGLLIPFGLQVWMFLSPVIYPSDLMGETAGAILALNPVVAAVNMFRQGVFGGYGIDVTQILAGVLVAIVALIMGLIIFIRLERDLADYV